MDVSSIKRMPAKTTATLLAALATTMLVGVSPALAISNGSSDGDGHPNVGLFAIEFADGGDPVIIGNCSGAYAGPRVGQAPGEVFITAAHCLDWLSGEGITADQLLVTFDSEVNFLPDSDGEVVSVNTWYRGLAYGHDPEFGVSSTSPHDFGAIVLTEVPDGLDPIEMPARHLLDDLADRGAMSPRTLFDSAGYGVVPLFHGPPSFEFAPGRMFATSRYKGLTRNLLKLNQNSELDGNGGGCYGDSGAPKLVHDSNVAVAITTGGDPLCRANSNNLRLDTGPARRFYGDFVELP